MGKLSGETEKWKIDENYFDIKIAWNFSLVVLWHVICRQNEKFICKKTKPFPVRESTYRQCTLRINCKQTADVETGKQNATVSFAFS